MPEGLQHTVRRMVGRDPHESGRAATPLELFFDLTFVIAFGTAADQLAHALAEDHVSDGIVGFCFATFAVSWAWINFTWFASAYDTDDWIFRLTTMVQMVGVLVLALGLPQMFASLSHGDHVDNSLMVVGYVIMRVPMLFQWLRASREDPERREVCRVMAGTLLVTQVGWILLLLADLTTGWMFFVVVLLVLLEISGPVVAETRLVGTPWHGHHIAERYGLMVIIALGEGLLGTTAALGALIEDGWTTDIVVLGLSGTALTFGVWWTYFVIPHGHLLSAHRERSFGWGYWHIPLFGVRGRDRRRAARRGVLPRGPLGAVRHRDGVGAGGSARRLRRLSVPALRPDHADRGPLPLPADRSLGRGHGPVRLAGLVGRVDGLVPDRARAGAVGDGRGLRDRRPPPQRRGAGQAGGGADRALEAA